MLFVSSNSGSFQYVEQNARILHEAGELRPMREETARVVYARVIALDPLINELFESADAVEDETLRSQFKKAVGEVMGTLYFEIMLPLEKRYPALIPETERPSTKLR
ncbi:hypothetical protein GA0061101_15035 [Rhizobium lusitanum]|uniref:Uncharacterized protein n=2 Tax=Rhizobium lusitanum TaxID=293958 RepID=A0A1C3XJT7_9HYPH|nr:hypothetical protein GA0061101_15035 [Rhizobium lusitanum]